MQFSKLCIAIIVSLLAIANDVNAQACTAPNGEHGVIFYNSAHAVWQVCTPRNWVSINSAVCPDGDGGMDPCSFAGSCSTPVLGTVCTDGSVYIGELDGNNLFAAAEDEDTVLSWGPQGIEENASNSVDGLANTNWLVSSSPNFHPAAQACRDRGAEWYLPARNELNLLWNNGEPLAGVDRSGTAYWSSNRYGINRAYDQNFMDGTRRDDSRKHWLRLVRCMRR